MGKKRTSEIYYEKNSDFEPTRETKLYWRKTRKHGRKYEDITLPGLFETIYFLRDRIFLGLILFFEFLGFVLLGFAVNWHIFLYLIGLGAIVLDFFLVLWAHWLSGRVCELRNRILVYEWREDQPEKRRASQKILLIQLGTKLPAYLLIFLVAVAKIYFYIDAKGGFDLVLNPESGTYDIAALLVCVIYLLIFIFHVSFSGYAIHGIIFKRKIGREYERFLATNNRYEEGEINVGEVDFKVKSFRANKITRASLANKELNKLETNSPGVRSHFISNLGNGDYLFQTWSVLQDGDLYSLAIETQQNPKARRFVAMLGLQAQLEMLGSDGKFFTTT